MKLIIKQWITNLNIKALIWSIKLLPPTEVVFNFAFVKLQSMINYHSQLFLYSYLSPNSSHLSILPPLSYTLISIFMGVIVLSSPRTDPEFLCSKRNIYILLWTQLHKFFLLIFITLNLHQIYQLLILIITYIISERIKPINWVLHR
jgi:hypothetical protein